MKKDPIVAQVRKVRDAYAAEFDNDFDAVYKDWIDWQQKTGHNYDLPPKRRKPRKKVA